MDGDGYGAAENAGEVLLQLLRNPPTSKSTTSPPQQQGVSEDPAVAAVGPAIHTIPLQHAAFASNSGGLPYPQWNHGSTSTPPFVSDRYFKQNPALSPNLNPDISLRRDRFSQSSRQVNDQVHLGGASRNFRSAGDSSRSGLSREVEQNLVFGSFNRNVLERDTGDVRIPNFRGNNTGNASVGGSSGIGDRRFNRHPRNSVEVNGRRENSDFFTGDDQGTVLTTVNHRKQSFNGTHRGVGQPPGYSNIPSNVSNKDYDFGRRNSGQLVDGHKSYLHTSDRSSNHRAEPPCPPDRNRVAYVGTMFVVESPENDEELNADSQDKAKGELGLQDGLDDQFAKILEVGDESVDKPENKKHHRDKDYRSDQRGQWIMNQRMRHMKSQMRCRSDIYRFDAPLLEIFESLNPAEEEKMKQMHLLRTLEDLVVKEWPDARLHVYGSCANSFGFPKSDIDVCLVMELDNTDKTEVLLKLAEILEAANLQDVQAFTRARVPIVKLKDPETGIACDICVNNVLAVLNTRLLRDYAKIDSRVRQLAFIVKHWAKSRLVNDTYHGTLSSYAYVLMCIHLLQQRRPPILPCLQEMESTFSASIENVECSYFDQVDKLQNFGSENRETIARLVWAFFHYWAYCHDYASDVISIRTGTTLSKQDKDWTRRIGNDRHLICIEDPFELSHDLGRVVDKHSVRVLREEFERAARIMQHDPNPCLTLFEPYVPN